MLFCVGGCILKWCWTAVRDCNSASHNMDWTCSCSVDIVTELAEGYQLAHAHKPGMKKNFQSFPFWWHKPDMCMTISFRDIIYLFRIPFIQTLCTLLGSNHTTAPELKARTDASSQFVFDCHSCLVCVASIIPIWWDAVSHFFIPEFYRKLLYLSHG
jgi:hypothetical protein